MIGQEKLIFKRVKPHVEFAELLLSVLPPQTLGHLEKAVVLELTLKHLNALTAVTEQQHQKIIALQNGNPSKLDNSIFFSFLFSSSKILEKSELAQN